MAVQDRDLLAGACASVPTGADPEEQGVLPARREMPWQRGMRVGREWLWVGWRHKTGRPKGGGVTMGEGRGENLLHACL